MTDSGLSAYETPVGVIDLERVRQNAARVASYCREHALLWRPHIKTHKSLGVARIQLEAGASGLTVATPREAEVMAELTSDLLLAYPPVGEAKLERLMGLPHHVRLSVALDSEVVLEELSRAAARAGRMVQVLVELDVGLGRVGLAGPDEVAGLAQRTARLPGVDFAGILFYPGHIRVSGELQGPSLDSLSDLLGRTLDRLTTVGLGTGVVSGGSTPTLWNSHLVEGLTEIRAGSCIFGDREGLALGVTGLDDIAYTVAATVVSTSVRGRAVVDAGSKALSKEVRSDDGSFGVLRDRPEVTVVALSEEHGVLDLTSTEWTPRIGEVVEIVPNHVCVSVNLQDYVVARDASRVEPWPLEARGRGPHASSAPPLVSA